jgi:formylglycine-generating enzyme required for sulfatase activity
MGSPPGETGRRPDEAQVNVSFPNGYWMAKYETTQRLWLRTMDGFPDKPPTEEFGIGDNIPVYWVSYLNAEEYCAKLNETAQHARTLPGDWEFRLPTEAQWEYGCRAGTTTATHYGDVFGFNHANFGSNPLNGGDSGTPHARSIEVGQYQPNAWGICDMHGNIFELCRDYYHARLPGGVNPDLYAVRGQRNGDGTYSRVRRGGAWIEEGWVCRSAARFRYEPERNSDHIGFRIVIVQI